MPFTKETAKKYGKMGGKANIKNRRDLFDLVSGEHKDAYNEKLEKLRDAIALTKEEKQFMDRVERLFPYKYAKLARSEEKIIVEDKRVILD